MPMYSMKQTKKTQRARSLNSAAAPGHFADDPFSPPPGGASAVLPTKYARLLDTLTSEERKTYPMTEGLGDYFPDALAEVAHISWAGNEKHNPGEKLHWARGKSMDHADCCARHLQQRGGFDIVMINGVEHKIRHSAQLAWRAMALLQEELEAEEGYALPRGASAPGA